MKNPALRKFGLKCEVDDTRGRDKSRLYIETIEGGVRMTVANGLTIRKNDQLFVKVYLRAEGPTKNLAKGVNEVCIMDQETCLRVSAELVVKL